jgi:DNA-directed RNA polymerase subunit RPC12/RpoP
VTLKCRNPSCKSIKAIQVNLGPVSGNGQRLYKCAVCGHPITVSVGGSFTGF